MSASKGEMRRQALRHRNLGRILPVRNQDGKKRPMVKWGSEATRDRDQIRQWFSAPDFKPTGYGISMGDGYLALDVDERRGGTESLAKLEEKYGPLPQTRRHRTADGEHIILALNGTVPRSDPDFAPGIELKSRGTFIMGPGSEHPSGVTYEVLDDVEPAPVPNWINERVQASADAQPDGDLDADAQGEKRNISLTSYAGKLRAAGCTRSEIRDALEVRNRRFKKPLRGKEREELDTIAKSVARYPTNVALKVEKADFSQARRTRWLYDLRLVLGRLNLLVGKPDVGKGNLIAWLIARLTLGELPGEFYGQPVVCGISGDEDSWREVWLPRLYAAGADEKHIYRLSHEEGLRLRSNRDALRDVVTSTQMRLLYLDSLIDSLGDDVDAHKSKSVRKDLMSIVPLLDELDFSLLGTLHTNKYGDDFQKMLTGSHAFSAVPRAAVFVSKDPDDPTRRLLTKGKGNQSESRLPAVSFVIEGYDYTAPNGDEIRTSRVADVQLGEETNADEVIAQLRAAEKPPRHTKAELGREIIRHALADGEWHRAKPIIEELATHGLDADRAKKLRREMGVEWRTRDEKQGGVDWRLPGDDE